MRCEKHTKLRPKNPWNSEATKMKRIIVRDHCNPMSKNTWYLMGLVFSHMLLQNKNLHKKRIRVFLPGKHILLYNLYIPFSFHSSFQNKHTANTVCNYAPRYHQTSWLLNWTLKTRWMVSLADATFMITNNNIKFGLLWMTLGPQHTMARLGHVQIWLIFAWRSFS